MSATARIDDLLDLDAMLTPEDKELRETVRRFGEQRLRPHIAEWFEAGEVPVRELASDLGKLGILGMHLEGYGCGGSTATAYGLVCQELEAVDSGLRSLVSVQGSLAMFAIHRHGSEEQREQWLPAMATGDAIGCFGLTEPDFGSNPGGMRTTARRDGSDWILNGSKMWITNGSVADVAVVWARAEEGVLGFLVPGGTKGFDRHRYEAQAVAAGVGDLGADSSTTCGCPPRRSCPRRGACRVRSPVCRRPGSASCSAAWAPRGTVWRRPSTTWAPARCSTSRWRDTN